MNTTRLPVLIISLMIMTACNGDIETHSVGNATQQDLQDLQSYKSSSPYAHVLANCARAAKINQYCTFNELPLLGLEVDLPTRLDILNRVVVSHSWMGEAFETLLNRFPSKMLTLFRGITAIVIDDDVRPAFYLSSTGAIYLDPAFLWLTNEEKATINPKEDDRIGLADPLMFRTTARYMNGNQQAFNFYSLTGTEERSIADIEYGFARILLHELAHANDFFPSDLYRDINREHTPRQTAQNLKGNYISDRLNAFAALDSEKMLSLAAVMYSGKEPSEGDLNTTASEAGETFASEGAADDYGYTTQHEDVAMLFEETMMKYLWGFDYDTAFIEVPGGHCSEVAIITAWAQRNRIGDHRVQPRAEFVTNALLHEVNMSSFYENLESARNFVPGTDWCEPAQFMGDAQPSGTTMSKPSPMRYIHTIEVLKPYL